MNTIDGQLLTDDEKAKIFRLFWRMGYLDWRYDDYYPNGGFRAPAGGYLTAANEHGNNVEIIAAEPDEARYRLRSAEAKAYAEQLRRGLLRMIEQLGAEA